MPSIVTVDFPTSLLHSGTNHVSITTFRGGWVLYDAVTLAAPPGDTLGTVPPVLLASAEWLHDVLTRKDGQLQQVLRVVTFNSGPATDVTLQVSGEADRAITIPGGRSVQEQSYPEATQESQTQVQVAGQSALLR